MILTVKVKHSRDFTEELKKALVIAQYAIKNRDKLSSKYMKHIGLKSIISNAIMYKYGRNKKCKRVSRVKLSIPGQSIQYDKENNTIYISSLKLTVNVNHRLVFDKVNSMEVDNVYCYISGTVTEKTLNKVDGYIGVDLNTTGHCAVAGNPETGKVTKLGKQCEYTHKKYKTLRRKLQSQDKYKVVKKIKNRESRIVRDINHKVSKKLVSIAMEAHKGIKLEKLEGIRKNKKQKKSFKYALHSWSFFQLNKMIEYKAQLAGIPVIYVDPAYTSKTCSRCGLIGARNDKKFKCSCGHVDHADVNASFNIALRPQIESTKKEISRRVVSVRPKGNAKNSSDLKVVDRFNRQSTKKTNYLTTIDANL